MMRSRKAAPQDVFLDWAHTFGLVMEPAISLADGRKALVAAEAFIAARRGQIDVDVLLAVIKAAKKGAGWRDDYT